MSKVFYNKLVRDRIQDKIRTKGEQCEVRDLTDDAEFEQELLKKVIEEAKGLAYARTREEFLNEYADLMVVLDALTQQLDIAPAELQLAMEDNIEAKGLYKKRQFLHWSDDSNYQSNETPQGVR